MSVRRHCFRKRCEIPDSARPVATCYRRLVCSILGSAIRDRRAFQRIDNCDQPSYLKGIVYE